MPHDKIDAKGVLEMSESEKAKSEVAATGDLGGLGSLILQRLDIIDGRLDRMDQRMDRMEGRIERLDMKVSGLERWAFSTILAVVVGAGAVVVTMVAHP